MGHIRLGRYNQLEIVKEVDFGVYLDGDEDGEILLPKRYVPQGCQVGDILNVFIYLDMEERLVATTIEPYAQVGDFAYLQVAWVNQYGAFLDWGLMKDLFVPFREQKEKMVKGKSYLVYIYIDDESFRIMASAKIEHFLSDEFPEYQNDECVDILVWKRTDLGFKVDNVNNGDNPKLNALTLAMMMDVNVSETMNVEGDNVFVNFELDHAINAMSFTYGALFENQISNIQSKFYKALIYTSSDGITWDLAQDWTEEFAADANAKGLSRKDIKFENQIQYVRIAFDSNFIGKYFTVALNSFAFYLES